MPATLRPARPEDAAALAAVHVHSWKETYAGLMPEAFLERLTGDAARGRREQSWAASIADASQIILVAEQDGDLVGFVAGGAARDHPGYDGELYAIYLLRAAQGGGLGAALLRAFAGELRAHGFRGMALWVLRDNPTVGFYERLGGRPDGERRVEIPEGELRELRFVWPDLADVR